MNIYQALKKDHNKLKPLLDQLVAASQNDESTKALLDQIRDELVPHSRAEEAVFYNTLRGIELTKESVNHGYREHMEAETVLRTLRGLEKINIEWTAAAEKLRDALNHHIEEEETQIFAEARQVLSDEEAQQLAVAFQQVKAQSQEQGDMKNTMDMVANLMPKRIGDRMRNLEMPAT